MRKIILALFAILVGCAVDVEKRGSLDLRDHDVSVINDDDTLDVDDPDAKAPPPPGACGLPQQCKPWTCWVDNGGGHCVENPGQDYVCMLACGRPAMCPRIIEMTKCTKECAWTTNPIDAEFCWASCNNATSTSCQPGVAN